MINENQVRDLILRALDEDRRRRRLRQLRTLALALILLPVALWAATKPYTFSAGAEIRAEEFNANFDALYAEKKFALIFETDVVAATNSIIIPGLNGNTDVEYQLIARVKSGSAAPAYYLRINGDTTVANYGQAYIQNGGTGGTLASQPGIAVGSATVANEWGLYNGLLHASVNGSPRMFVTTYVQQVSGATVGQAGINSGAWNNTTSNITQIEFYSTVAGGLAAGTHIEVWARR